MGSRKRKFDLWNETENDGKEVHHFDVNDSSFESRNRSKYFRDSGRYHRSTSTTGVSNLTDIATSSHHIESKSWKSKYIDYYKSKRKILSDKGGKHILPEVSKHTRKRTHSDSQNFKQQSPIKNNRDESISTLNQQSYVEKVISTKLRLKNKSTTHLYKTGQSTSSSTVQKNKDHVRTLLPHENELTQRNYNVSSCTKTAIKAMSFKKLQSLLTKSASEILLTILDKKSGFSMCLDQEINRDITAYILLAVGKAVDSYMEKNITKMILSITSNKNFLLVNLQQYLASFQKCKSESYHLDSLLSLSEFLHRFQNLLPSNAADILIILLPLLKQTCENSLKDHEQLYPAVSEKVHEIDEQNTLVLKKYVNETEQTSYKESFQLMNPPENYRSIPVMPNDQDIFQECAFLRPNIVKGKYQDTEHYLDVQYRLLREDYVKPLRDGIAEYLKLLKKGKSVKHCKDVRVYPNVHILKQEFVNGGLVHIAQFEDNFSQIKWEYSKRFLTGSLLCLSSDNFTTMLFASVAHREPNELKKGLLSLRFEELTDEVLNISPLSNFVVIETSAYFEAYRHNLNVLLQLNEENLPMKRYIVDTQKTIQNPLYLSEDTTYDMRPLLLPMECSNEDDINELQTDVSEKAKSINVLKENCWPTAGELNLDLSQYAALKAAITKEFTVIQGPPGTGKTFVGLRIAQLLIHNIEKWQSDVNQLPILVICYTNHALDQFLEGLLHFTDKLVRVGGRSKNEALSEFQLGNLKKTIKLRRQVPHYIFSNVKQKYFHIGNLKRDINKIQKSVKECYTSILSDNKITDCMSAKHYTSLKFDENLFDDGYLLHDWLGIRNTNTYSMFRNSGKSTLELHNAEKMSRESKEFFEEEEADIDYIEDQRNFIPDEIEEISYDEPSIEFERIQLTHAQEVKKKRLQKYIANNLQNCCAMLEQDAIEIQNIWDLKFQSRWCLYKFWLECYVQEIEKEIWKVQEELHKEYDELCEMRMAEDIHVCKEAVIVGMTTTGAAKYRHIVQHLNPKIVIVEEAAEILESHIVTSLAPGTQHVILIGDHQQLRPSPTVHLLAVKYDLNVSLFERMVENGMDCYKLGIQHRMRPEIAALISPHIYDNLQNHESVTKYENIKGISKSVFFISHAHKELQECDSKSKVNQHEAKFMINLCKYILLQGYKSSQITVLTTYSGQLFEMKRLCSQGILQGVKFTVVDNYQGEENDIILISFVRSNEDEEIGFLKVSNRVCVALSRAKIGLFCIGNFELFAKKSDLWKNIVNQLVNDKAIGSSLQLVCQNHPEVSNIVATEKDFDVVPEGGCNKKCEFRLKCGHTCTLMCHLYDVEHANIQCQKPCNKNCNEGHLCKRKCHQECGLCQVKILKKLEDCEHTIEVDCYRKTLEIPCAELCDKFLPCGHMCSRKCSKKCTRICNEKVRVTSVVCGHKVVIKCSEYKNLTLLAEYCKEPCKAELPCGHMCKGTCGTCHQGRLHIACHQVCKRILVCGHECRSSCSKSCPPCKQKCENTCFHNKCPKSCGAPCTKCTESCKWSCPHKKCNRLCGEPCDRTACDEPCPKILKCKHPCIGLCGEPCPMKCRICHEKQITEIFFGSEDEADARFIRLQDCNHIFELNGITQWMELAQNEEEREVQMKACPKCKVVIRKSLRFGNIIKSCLADIEKVKQKVYGNTEKNNKFQQSLLERLKKDCFFISSEKKFLSICKSFTLALESRRSRSKQEITKMENIINILFLLFEVTQSDEIAFHSSDIELSTQVTNLEKYIKLTKKWLTVSIEKAFSTASEHQLEEITWEVHRLKLASNLSRYLRGEPNIPSSSPLNALLESIMTKVPFREEEAKKFVSEYKHYVELIGGANISVTELEKQSILKAMGLSKGHWYQCPKGHIYCITECGGAMQESKCNECGEKIGGTRHTLVSTNRVATAMDGAQHSAWSDAMNMENYQF